MKPRVEIKLLGMMIGVSLSLSLGLISAIPTQNCRFTKVSGLTATYLLRMEGYNDYFWFENYGDAQVACTNLEPCTGVIGNAEDGFKILTGFPRRMSRGAGPLWLKECKPLCELVLTEESVDGMSLFARRCSHSENDPADIDNVIWSMWESWAGCSQTCGQDGVQSRIRKCVGIIQSKRDYCNVTEQEFRSCLPSRNCAKSVQDVYGVTGPEGFVIAISTRIYKTCIHIEEADRLKCGDQAVVTRDLCDQYDCCYQENWHRTAGPKCFQTQSFIGSVGRLGWAIWNAWSSCTATCGNGIRVRYRICTGSVIGSPICPDSDREIQVCGSIICPCDSTPCLNGGTCVPNENVLYGYECVCTSGFSGRNCFYGEPDLKCGDDSITVQFHEGLVVDDGLIPDSDLIHFSRTESKECFAQKQENIFYLSLPPPIDTSCGSELYISNDHLTITNKVLWKLSDGFFDATVVLVDIECVYNKRINSSVGLGFGIQPVLRTISEKRVVNAFDANMYLYRDNSFLPSHRFRSAPRIAQGELLYVAIELHAIKISNFASVSLKADACWVMDALDETSIVQQLIKDGCPTNDVFTSVIENGNSQRVKLAIRVFDWKSKNNSSNDVFFQCKVRACTPECASNCMNATSLLQPNARKSGLTLRSYRKRRDVEGYHRYSALLRSKIIIL